jgi:hypothetical protein
MKLVLIMMGICLNPGSFQEPGLQAQFDNKPIAEATELLVDHMASNGKEGIEPILFDGISPMIEDFSLGLKVYKMSSGEGFATSRRQFSFSTISQTELAATTESAEFRAFLERYYRGKEDLSARVLEYAKSQKAEKVIRLTIPLPDRSTINWILFFKLNAEKKWRLDETIPNFKPPQGGFFIKTQAPGENLSVLSGIIICERPRRESVIDCSHRDARYWRPRRESNSRP